MAIKLNKLAISEWALKWSNLVLYLAPFHVAGPDTRDFFYVSFVSTSDITCKWRQNPSYLIEKEVRYAT